MVGAAKVHNVATSDFDWVLRSVSGRGGSYDVQKSNLCIFNFCDSLIMSLRFESRATTNDCLKYQHYDKWAQKPVKNTK